MSTPTPPSLIRLHGLVPFDRSGKARWLLLEMGVPFEDRWLNREEKEYESPAFLRLNPMGRVPVLEIEDQAIFESGAICAVLADRFLEKGLAPPLASRERADYQKWMYFAASTLDVFQTRIMVIEDIPAGSVQAEKLTALQSELRDAMETLDSVLSKNTALVTNRFSAADICVGYHLYWCKLWPELASVMQDFPSVLSYLERLKARPAAIQADVFSFQG